MTEAPVPTAIAMLVCDQVIVEIGTNKKSLIGVFENLFAQSFPAVTRMSVYAKLKDADGQYDFLIRLVNLKDESVITEVNATNIQLNSMGQSEVVLNFMGLSLPAAGMYEFQLYANGIYLHRATLKAIIHDTGGLPWQPQPPS